MKTTTSLLRLALLNLALIAPSSAQELGEAPMGDLADFVSVPDRLTRQAVAVNPMDRAAVINFYQNVYRASQSATAGWTGDRSTCDAGTTTPDYADATILRVNYFRAMAGLPGDVTLSNLWNLKCQAAALMMSVNNTLSHNPPTNWICYSADGKEAAGKSNIALGATGPGAIDLYIDDPGSGNSAAGHRRWILYPPCKIMGSGSIPSGGGAAAHALWVIGGAGSRPSQPAWVAWPPPGFVPYPVLPRSSRRWSFSYPGATFTNARVYMERGGTNVTLTLEPLAQGYGDNTIVWVPQGLPTSAPSPDVTYSVTVSNVVVNSQSRVFNYQVTIVDPDVPMLTARTSTPNTLVLAWPSTSTGYTLQQSATLTNAAAWGNVSATPQNTGGEYRVTVSTTNRVQFFRLRKP